MEMKKLNAFTSLPTELLSLLVTEWLKWSDLGHCDSAMCNRDLRKVWLDLLKNGCIFRDMLPISWDCKLYFGWILTRSICSTSLNIDWCPFVDENMTDGWFQHTGPFIKFLTIRNVEHYMMHSIERYCTNLQTLSTGGDFSWDIVCNNPQLQTLQILGNGIPVCSMPTAISLPWLTMLGIGYSLFAEDLVVVLQQLPSLLSLKMDQIYIFGADALSGVTIPKLKHLQIESACRYLPNSNKLGFLNLLGSSQSGLRCLVIPASIGLTAGELRTIAYNHGHSLRCLSINGYPDEIEQSTQFNLADALNRMPLLHTLQLPYTCLAHITMPIVNLSITHLYVDLGSTMDSLKGIISSQLPSLHTISLSLESPEFMMPGTIVSDVTQLLELRPLIRTLCVDINVGLFGGLRASLPHINVLQFSPIDIFTTDY